MYHLNKVSAALAAVGLSAAVLIGQSVIADTDNAVGDAQAAMSKSAATKDVSPVTNGVSQKLTGDNKTSMSLNKLLPTIKYSTENLPAMAKKVNDASWTPGTNIDRTIGTKLQALLNWHHSGVGAVDGY
ncbi:MAG: murein L,D-transpeptidase, partial [Psychrobacter sp.]|nr:murein L,D-transpeptidase [Psychrobacter sp.]